MSEQENIKVVQAIVDMVRTNTLDRTPEFFHADYLAEVPGADSPLNRDQARQWTQNFVDAFSDLQFDIQRIIAQGDHVVLMYTMSGAHTGSLPLPTGGTLQPTGRPMKTSACFVYTLRDGKVARAYGYMDQAHIMGQLGMLPPVLAAREVGA
jgi:ketosteroid isomerase-like protein